VGERQPLLNAQQEGDVPLGCVGVANATPLSSIVAESSAITVMLPLVGVPETLKVS
jgi:hypothetical protein